MFGMEYIAALIKITTQIGFAIVTAIPFRLAWNTIAPAYLNFIPEIYQNFGYWDVVSVILICTYVGELLTALIPKIVTITATNSK